MCEYCEGGKPIRENPLVSVVGGIIFMRVKRNKKGIRAKKDYLFGGDDADR